MASVSQWPGSGRDALMEELNSDLAGESSADLAANALALKILCIRAEIQTDTPTPAEDQALRREHQLQRLVQSMGQGLGADETSLDTMAIDWVRVGRSEERREGTECVSTCRSRGSQDP